MKKIITILAAILATGCQFDIDWKFESYIDLNEQEPPESVWNMLDESTMGISDITQSETLDTTNFDAKNDAGAATIMYFNSPVTTALPPVILGTGPDAGDPLDSTIVVEAINNKPQRFKISGRFKVDSGDKSIVGGQDNLGQERYEYTGSRTCQFTVFIDATWNAEEETLTMIEQKPVIEGGNNQGEINCVAGCEEGNCPNGTSEYPKLPLSLAQFPENRALFFTDNELDLTLVGGQYEDNAVSFRMVIQDLTPGPAPVADLRPIATQYEFNAVFLRP